MTLDAPSVVAQWQAPPWAERHLIDEQAVIHSRTVGTFQRHPLDHEQEVRLVQRDEFDEVGDIGSITRQPAYFVVDGDMITVTHAPALARLLLAGTAIVQNGEVGRSPAAGHLDLPSRMLILARRWVEAVFASPDARTPASVNENVKGWSSRHNSVHDRGRAPSAAAE